MSFGIYDPYGSYVRDIEPALIAPNLYFPDDFDRGLPVLPTDPGLPAQGTPLPPGYYGPPFFNQPPPVPPAPAQGQPLPPGFEGPPFFDRPPAQTPAAIPTISLPRLTPDQWLLAGSVALGVIGLALWASSRREG